MVLTWEKVKGARPPMGKIFSELLWWCASPWYTLNHRSEEVITDVTTTLGGS
jgi:hypothetical protein